MPVRIGSPVPSTLSELALGIPCSETTDSAQFWVLPYISSHLDFRSVEKRGRTRGGTFVPHFEQKSPHPFLLKNKNLPAKTRAASPQPFMFQYVCRSPIIRLHCMHATPTAIEECRLLPTLGDFLSTSALFSRSLPTSSRLLPTVVYFCRVLPTSADFCLPVPTQSLFMLYIGTGWCYMYSSVKRSVNAKRLPPLPGQTSRGRPREKSRAYSIYSSRNRSGSEFRAES